MAAVITATASPSVSPSLLPSLPPSCPPSLPSLSQPPFLSVLDYNIYGLAWITYRLLKNWIWVNRTRAVDLLINILKFKQINVCFAVKVTFEIQCSWLLEWPFFLEEQFRQVALNSSSIFGIYSTLSLTPVDFTVSKTGTCTSQNPLKENYPILSFVRKMMRL